MMQQRARRPALGGLSPDGAALRVAVAVLPGAGARQETLRVTGDPASLAPLLEKLIA